MVMKCNGRLMKSPSSFKLQIDDQDLDSFRSTDTAELIDKTLAKGLIGLSVSWTFLTEEEAEEIMQQTWDNPMVLTIKCPILGKKTLTANFRCAKRTCEMISTEDEEESTETKWKVSFTASQKNKVEGQ